MTIQFLPPNPEQKEALDELEKLLEVLNKPVSKELKHNIKFVRKFTKSLFLAGRSYREMPKPKLTHEIRGFEQEKMEISKMPEISKNQIPSQKMQIPQAPIAPPAPQAAKIELTQELPSQISQPVKENGILKFNVLEPIMESADWKIFNIVKNNFKQKILLNPEVLQNNDFLTEEIKNTCKELKIKYSESYLQKITYYINKYLKGYGKIDPLINNPNVAEIICNSYNDIRVNYQGELLKTDIYFESNEELDNFLLNIAEKSKKELSDKNPQLSVSFMGLNIEAFYNPIMGSKFTIRKQ